jgi:hypothetical protein
VAAPLPMIMVPFGCRRFLVSISKSGDVNGMHELVLEMASTSPFRCANMFGIE